MFTYTLFIHIFINNVYKIALCTVYEFCICSHIYILHIRRGYKNLLLFIKPQTAGHHQLRGLKNIFIIIFFLDYNNVQSDRMVRLKSRLVAAVVAAPAAGARSVPAGVTAAATGRRVAAAVSAGAAGVELVVAGVEAGVVASLAEVGGEAAPATAAAAVTTEAAAAGEDRREKSRHRQNNV
jgi:hypothetical protein